MIDQHTDLDHLKCRLPDGLLDRLPPICHSGALHSDPDYYGASWIIANQLGMKQSLPTTAIWKHGWQFSPVSDFRQITGEVISLDRLYLVRDNSEASLLQNEGFTAVPVGLPFLYAMRHGHKQQRYPGSLLLMPMHGTTHTPVASQESTFLATVSQWRSQFAHVVGCVSGMCVKNGQWLKQLEANGIPWITGAWIFDRNALIRLRSILESFEYVLTNSFGSHILYAAAAGCKIVCIPEYGLLPADERLATTEPLYKRFPELLKASVDAFPDHSAIHSFLVASYPRFFSGFEGAEVCSAWAMESLGEAEQRSPSQIAHLLDWQPDRILCQRYGCETLSHLKLNFDLFSADPIQALVSDADALLVNCHCRLAEARNHLNRNQLVEARQLLAWIKSQRLPCMGVDQLRAALFLKENRRADAIVAVQEELAQFPSNAEAQRLLGQLQPQSPSLVDLTDPCFVLEWCTARSELHHDELQQLLQFATDACQRGTSGQFVECGVGSGSSAAMLAWALRRYARVHAEIFCFDSYEGYPCPGIKDRDASGCSLNDLGLGEGTSCFPSSSLRSLATHLGSGAHLRIVQGDFSETIPLWKPYITEISLLHIHARLYESTQYALHSFGDLLASDCLICVSDYHEWEGPRLAVDAYVSSFVVPPILRSLGSSGVCFTPT